MPWRPCGYDLRSVCRLTEIILRSRVLLTVMICSAVFLSCMNLNLEAPLYDRGYSTNDLNMAKDADTVDTIVKAWRGRPITETQIESKVVPSAAHLLTVARQRSCAARKRNDGRRASPGELRGECSVNKTWCLVRNTVTRLTVRSLPRTFSASSRPSWHWSYLRQPGWFVGIFWRS